jgi:hypothetical protein
MTPLTNLQFKRDNGVIPHYTSNSNQEGAG